MFRRALRVIVLSTSFCLTWAAVAVAAPAWRLVTLPALGGSPFSDAADVNLLGTAVGTSGDRVAVKWSRGVPSALPAPTGGAQFSVAVGVNTLGTVAGYARPSGFSTGTAGKYHPIIWTQAGAVDPLRGAGPDQLAQASAINERDQVVGYWQGPSATTAFLWERGRFQLLNDLDLDRSQAIDINNWGTVLLQAADPDETIKTWNDGVVRDVDGEPGAIGSWPVAINDRGEILGGSRLARPDGNDEYRYFLWRNGTRTSVTVPGCDAVGLNDLNIWGQAVGDCVTPEGTREPFVWRGGSVTFLPKPAGASQAHASHIDARGQVAGSVTDDLDGTTSAVIWAPTAP